MNWRERWTALPGEARTGLGQALRWMAGAALLDAACGLALLPLLQTWARGDGVPWGELGLLLGLSLVQALLQFGAARRGFLAGSSLAASLLRALIGQLPRIDVVALQRLAPAEGLLRGSVLPSMGLPAHLLAPLVSALLTPLAVVVGLALFDWRLAAGLALAGAGLAGLLRLCARRQLTMEQARQAAERALAEQVQSFATQQLLLRPAARNAAAAGRLELALDGLHRQTQALLRAGLPASLGFSLAVQAVFATVLLGGVWAVHSGTLDGARLLGLLLLLVRFIEPLAQLTHLDQALRGATQALDTALGVLALPALASPTPGETPGDASLGGEALLLRHEQTTLLQGLDLHLPAGSLTAIVGPSGAGKSSLLGLLARLRDPDSGRVLFGGVDARQLSETTLAAQRNLVFQDNGLLRGSIAWNLRMARPDADDAALRAALTAVGLDLSHWPQGLDSEVGPGGGLLSGGERQRLCLARAWLSNAPVLLLDEPTASLDAASEAQVLRSLLALRGNRTLVLVTHRPALARLADRVLVLEAGRLRAQGQHAALRQQDDWYAAFAGDAATLPAGEGSRLSGDR